MIKKKPYHHLVDGTFRNPEGSPKRDSNIKWSYKIYHDMVFKIKFDIVHDLLHEQIDMLIHSETFKKYSFLEVYESIVLIFVRGISTDKGIGILENFLIEYNAKSV